MKISKLFHWLYATLMFLPFIFFVPSLIYYGFNEHATAQEYTAEVPIYYETNDITSIADFQVDHIYRWNDNFEVDYLPSTNLNLFDIYATDNLGFISNLQDVNNITFVLSTNGNVYLRVFYFNSSDWLMLNNFEFDFVYKTANTNFSYTSYLVSYFSNSNLLLPTGNYTDVVYTMSIVDSVDFSWQRVWSLPLFSWTSNSFISQPFTYITGLFGMQPTNTFNNVATYFVTISICWLVFDLLMYVPNLAHRWLDRGAIE